MQRLLGIHTIRWLLAGLLLALLLSALPAAPVRAGTTYTVNALTDTGAGSGTTGDLRYAITQVNAGGGGDTVTITATGTITLTLGALVLARNVTIAGPGANVVTVDGGFSVRSGVTATISGLRIVHGDISNSGTLTLMNSILEGHAATITCNRVGGGAISNSGTLAVYNTTIAGNVARGVTSYWYFGWPYPCPGNPTTMPPPIEIPSGASVGALYNTGILFITRSTFYENTAMSSFPSSSSSPPSPPAYAGAILNLGTATITNSTFTNNTAYGGTSYGGAVVNSGTMTLASDTFADNSATVGANVSTSGKLSAVNTIFKGNTYASNCSGSITDGGHNLQSGSACSPTMQGGNPKLGTLALNGGLTATMALQPGSAAIDAGDDAACATDPIPDVAPNRDQRGVLRTHGVHCDIGAYEVGFLTDVSPNGGDSRGGTPVTLSGYGFGATASVTFDTTKVNPSAITPNTIMVVAPPHGAGTVNLTLTTNGQTVLLRNAYLYAPLTPLPSTRSGGVGVTDIPPNPIPTSRPPTSDSNPVQQPSTRPSGQAQGGNPSPLSAPRP